MEKFPPNAWEVRDLADMEDITVPAPSGSKFHLQALLVGKPSHGREGQFKFLIAGTDHMKFSVNLEEVINDPAFKGMRVDCEMELGSKVRFNCLKKRKNVINTLKRPED